MGCVTVESRVHSPVGSSLARPPREYITIIKMVQ